MLLFFIIFIAMLIVVLIMSIGVLSGKKPIAGSCGGVAEALNEANYTCPICGDDPNNCETKN